MATKRKRAGFGLEMKTFPGKDGHYLVFRTPDGKYHAFLEVEAKEASRQCGCRIEGTTHQMWNSLWKAARGAA